MWWAVCRFLITRRLHYWPNVRRREMQWLNKRVYIIEGENSARAAFCCLSNYTLGNSQKSLPLPSPQTHMLAATHAAVIPPLLSCDALLKCYLFFSLKANFIYVSLVHVTSLIPMHFCPVANRLCLVSVWGHVMKYFGPKLMCYYYRRTEVKMTESLRIFRSEPDWLPEGKVGVDPWRPIHRPKKT